MPANVYRFDERWSIPGHAPDAVWDVLADGRRLPEWWRGVYERAEPIGPAHDRPTIGAQMRVRVRGFLPYHLDFTVESTALERPHVVEVRAHGDFEGVWRATLAPEGDGTGVDVLWTVTVHKPIIRYLSPLLRPLFAWNHRWAMPRGEAGLRAYLVEHPGQDGSDVSA